MRASLNAKLMKMLKMIGPYTGVRYLRNQGVNFHQAHCMVLGVTPRFK